MKKILTKSEYIIAAGLFYMAQEAYRKLEQCEKSYGKLVNYPQTYGLDSGHFGDEVFGGGSIEDVIQKEGIKIKK